MSAIPEFLFPILPPAKPKASPSKFFCRDRRRIHVQRDRLRSIPWVESVGQRQSRDVLGLRRLGNVGIHVEHDRHFTLFAGSEVRLVEAEALYLVEIGTSLDWRDVEDSLPASRLVGFVFGIELDF